MTGGDEPTLSAGRPQVEAESGRDRLRQRPDLRHVLVNAQVDCFLIPAGKAGNAGYRLIT